MLPYVYVHYIACGMQHIALCTHIALSTNCNTNLCIRCFIAYDTHLHALCAHIVLTSYYDINLFIRLLVARIILPCKLILPWVHIVILHYVYFYYIAYGTHYIASGAHITLRKYYVNFCIRGSLNKFPDFFRMGTFIDSTHMKL